MSEISDPEFGDMARAINAAGDPEEWAMLIIYRRDGEVMVWGRQGIDGQAAAEGLAAVAAKMAVRYPGGDVPSGW